MSCPYLLSYAQTRNSSFIELLHLMNLENGKNWFDLDGALSFLKPIRLGSPGILM